MKAEKISDAMNMLDDDIVDAADTIRTKRKGKKYWRIAIVAVAACLCLVLVEVLNRGGADTVVYAISKAEYPERVQCPNMDDYTNPKTGDFDYEAFQKAEQAWSEDQAKYNDGASYYTKEMREFVGKSTTEFLKDSQDGNLLYSPANVYMALCMLAETTDKESRQQILDLLEEKSIEDVRTKAKGLWNANYCNDGATTCILANSIWLNNSIDYNKETMETLKNQYYTSAFKGEPGTAGYDKELQNWLNEQTGGLLKEQASNIRLSPTMVMALASTIYFKASWQNEFLKNATKQDVFHEITKDIQCDFMHQTMLGEYSQRDGFSATTLPFTNGWNMHLILPDQGVTPEQLLQNEECMKMIKSGALKDTQRLRVNLSMPKFDVSSEYDLKEGLQQLGVKDVFEGDISDFTPINEEARNVYLNRADHAVRVLVDEEGCEAAAFTVMGAEGACSPPNEKVDFVLDRPFLFFITGEDGMPLFVGVVNQPV